MRTSDLLKSSLQELNDKLKEIKSSEEDDFGKLAEMFDDVSETADKVATKFSNADKAFSDQEESDEPQGKKPKSDEEDNENDDEDTDEAETKPKK